MQNETIDKVLNSLPFVKWDRFTFDGHEYLIYGWIDRDDKYKDFVLLTFGHDNNGTKWVSSVTSSSSHSKEIAKILGVEEYHNECVRVEGVFTKVINVARLES